MGAKPPVDVTTVDVLPILPSLNFQQTADFYVNQLGFKEEPAWCDDYRAFRRGRMELYFWLCENHEIAVNSSVFIRTANALDLYEEYAERAVRGLRGVEGDTGETEKFHVRDPHGNVLIFLSPGYEMKLPAHAA